MIAHVADNEHQNRNPDSPRPFGQLEHEAFAKDDSDLDL